MLTVDREIGPNTEVDRLPDSSDIMCFYDWIWVKEMGAPIRWLSTEDEVQILNSKKMFAVSVPC